MKTIKKSYISVIALSALLCCTTSCKKNMFNEEVYNKILQIEFPIDPVDDEQDWELTTRRTATVNVPTSLKDATRLMVLSDNPATNADAVIMAETNRILVGSNVLVFAAPKARGTLYAALEQADGSLLVKSFTASDSRPSMADATQIAKPAKALSYQTFTYCFEEDYPAPGDYDFNDCVLRIAVAPGQQSNQRKISVTLAATGGDKLIGAAINILNYKYDDIESVVEEDGVMWDEGYPAHRWLMDNTATFQKGRNGEAVIRLFENASWIMVRNDVDNAGGLINYKVNVNHGEVDKYREVTPVTKTYIVTFKQEATTLLNNFTLLSLDPFVVTVYNSGTWETHTYPYKHSNILFEGVQQNSSTMTWALCVPDGEFRWPLEGVLIGRAKDGIITGAYRQPNHAFGSWAAKKSRAQDWYLYPTETSVY